MTAPLEQLARKGHSARVPSTCGSCLRLLDSVIFSTCMADMSPIVPQSMADSDEFLPSDDENDGFCAQPVELTPDLAVGIVKQVEFYFSDANLATDKKLLKQIRKGSNGTVPVKLFANYRKVRALTKDPATISAALQSSSLLQLSDDGKLVHRVNAVPDYNVDDIQRRTIVVEHLPDAPTIESVTEMFAVYGKVNLVRICSKESKGKLPHWLTATTYSLHNQRHAFVEFCDEDSAVMAVAALHEADGWGSGVTVRHLLVAPSDKDGHIAPIAMRAPHTYRRSGDSPHGSSPNSPARRSGSSSSGPGACSSVSYQQQYLRGSYSHHDEGYSASARSRRSLELSMAPPSSVSGSSWTSASSRQASARSSVDGSLVRPVLPHAGSMPHRMQPPPPPPSSSRPPLLKPTGSMNSALLAAAASSGWASMSAADTTPADERHSAGRQQRTLRPIHTAADDDRSASAPLPAPLHDLSWDRELLKERILNDVDGFLNTLLESGCALPNESWGSSLSCATTTAGVGAWGVGSAVGGVALPSLRSVDSYDLQSVCSSVISPLTPRSLSSVSLTASPAVAAAASTAVSAALCGLVVSSDKALGAVVEGEEGVRPARLRPTRRFNSDGGGAASAHAAQTPRQCSSRWQSYDSDLATILSRESSDVSSVVASPTPNSKEGAIGSSGRGGGSSGKKDYASWAAATPEFAAAAVAASSRNNQHGGGRRSSFETSGHGYAVAAVVEHVAHVHVARGPDGGRGFQSRW